MRQILQNLSTGETLLAELPAPRAEPGHVLIRTRASLVSLGTERMLVEFGRAGWLKKARQQPEKVRQVLDKVRSDGLLPTLEAVFRKLDEPMPLGYCNAGEVIAVGLGVTEFKAGDRVASNGPHAEIVSVPKALVVSIPDGVSDEEAAFTVIGAVGLQGIRLLNPALGETVAVIGLGLVGLLTAEFLRASGCRVMGFDFDPAKVGLAARKGVEALNLSTGADPVAYVQARTGGIGADGVIITASNSSDDIVSQAARMSRQRGRIVLVGVVGLNLKRAEFYQKELSFQVSCSYGPGRYDPDYEEQGRDYPLPFVRWTENRNFQAVLEAMATGRLDVKPLITETVDLPDYGKIYNHLGGQGSIASILRYPGAGPAKTETIMQVGPRRLEPAGGRLAVVGAGNFVKMTLLPALRAAKAGVDCIVSAGGVTGTALAKKYGIARSTTDYADVLDDPAIEAVIIATRHHLHAPMAVQALRAGKHVFVEKPLALTQEELAEVAAAAAASGKSVMVGFNRRFSPHVRQMQELLGPAAQPISVVATMNAGYLPPELWVHDPAVGGGRIVGEACHLVDLITCLTGSRVTRVCLAALGPHPSAITDTATLLLNYANGSLGVVNYFSTGHRAHAKERVEIHAQGRTLVLDNFRLLTGFGFKEFSTLKTRQDKGHQEQFSRYVELIRRGGDPLIPWAELVNTTRTTLAALESLQTGGWVEVEG